MLASRWLRGAAAVVVGSGAVLVMSGVTAPAAQALAPVNPVRVDVGGHPANSGFLVFVEGNVALNADESEGTVAAGGNFSFNSTYNVAAHTPKDSTFTAPGDSGPTYLYVGGGMAWAGSQTLRVLNSGFTKIADDSTYTARNKDSNNASVNYRVLKPGASYDSSPRIEGTTNQQTPASVATPVPTSLINVPAAFTQYRQLTTQMAECPTTTALTDPNGGSTPIPRPYAAGARGRLTLTPGQTNVLDMTTQDLENLSEITFTNSPSAQTPLIVNVIGRSLIGNVPNLAGISGNQAPYILWNFPLATSVVINGGASIEGTLYAPNATLNWRPTQNIEGNVIAAAFTHGPTALPSRSPREVHDFPFATTVSCQPITPPKGTLTLVKNVVNTGGGTARPGDWTLTADGPQTVTGPGNSAQVTNVPVPAGDYQLDEADGPGGYLPSAWHCTGGDLVGRTVEVDANADVTCTITNTYVPPPPPTGTLTLVKHVVNTGGGTATPDEWTLTAAGPQTVTGAGNSAAVTDVKVATGDYDLSETDGPSDYTGGAWTCTGGALAGSTVTITANADVTCEITNTYQPPPAPHGTITLVKTVVGGTATPDEWTLTATGPQTVTGAGNSPQVTGVVVPTGAYDLSEADGPVDYTGGAWSCTGGALAASTVTVTANADVTCTITNTFTPAPPPHGTLTLVKHVDNGRFGIATPDQWTLTADGPQVVTGAGNSPQVTGITVPTGDYALTESGGPSHYDASLWQCTGGALTGTTVTVAADADVTCTITNTYRPASPPTATLTLVKHVVNTGGGLATPDQWTLTADGPQTISGPGNSSEVTGVVVGIGDYQLSESSPLADYTPSDWACTGGALAGSTITLDDGADVTCEITNTYSPAPSPTAGSLTLVKRVDNTGGGTARPGDWTLTAAGPQTVTGAGNSDAVTNVIVATGDYDLHESNGPSRYAAGRWSCTGGGLSGTTVTVGRSATVRCEITNTFVAPTPTPTTSAPTSPTTSPTGTPSHSNSPTVVTTTSSASGGNGGLADTGASIDRPLLLGLGLLAAGALVLVSTRSRRRRRSH